jgi:hypothetical protein
VLTGGVVPYVNVTFADQRPEQPNSTSPGHYSARAGSQDPDLTAGIRLGQINDTRLTRRSGLAGGEEGGVRPPVFVSAGTLVENHSNSLTEKRGDESRFEVVTEPLRIVFPDAKV